MDKVSDRRGIKWQGGEYKEEPRKAATRKPATIKTKSRRQKAEQQDICNSS